jgi:ATP-dependent DNA helicase HFM1/MER3
MCESELEHKYKNLANGTTKLESSLHLNLDEHLNSEIGLGTITDVQSAKEWLRNSFLWRRLQKNPKHYAIGKSDGETWQEKIDQLVLQSVKKLKETELVEYDSGGDGELCSTEYGDIMSKVC